MQPKRDCETASTGDRQLTSEVRGSRKLGSYVAYYYCRRTCRGWPTSYARSKEMSTTFFDFLRAAILMVLQFDARTIFSVLSKRSLENEGGDVERILKPAVSRLLLIRSQEAPSLAIGLLTRLAQRLIKEIDHGPVVGFFLLASRGGENVTSQRHILPHFDGAVCEALAEGQS